MKRTAQEALAANVWRSSSGLYAVMALLLSSFASTANAALNLETDSVEDHIVRLRRQIFVEKKYLREPQRKECSSLGGPSCFGLPERSESTQTILDGVLPERLFQDLHGRINLTELITPSFDEIEFLRRQITGQNMTMGLTNGGDDKLSFGAARTKTEVGFLHFGDLDLQPKTRLFTQFSRGLPAATIANWEGKWLIRDCSKEEGASAPVLPTPDWLALPPPPADALVTVQSATPTMQSEGSKTITTTAQIQSAVSYIRFSRPVVVRSLFARWNPFPKQKKSKALQTQPPPAIISGRLGLDRTWTTQLDPKRATGHWVDIGGGPLSAVDEVVFIAAVGLEVGFLEVVAHGDTSEYESRTVLMLTPTPKDKTQTDDPAGDVHGRQKAPFTIHAQALSPASAAFVASLQEVVDNDLDLVAEPAGDLMSSQRNSAPVAGVISSSQPAQQLTLDSNMADVAWQMQAAQNEQMLDHATLPFLMKRSTNSPQEQQQQLLQSLGFQGKPLGLQMKADSDDEDEYEDSPMDRMMKEGARKNAGLPEDLRLTMKKRKNDIVKAANAWVQDGGAWRSNLTTILPQFSDEDAVKKYVTAKFWQIDLDHLTAAMLYLGRKAQMQTMSGLSNFMQPGLSGKAATHTGPTGPHMVDLRSLFGAESMDKLGMMEVQMPTGL